MREICDKHGILLIFDEVITGFGRLGTPFAATSSTSTPDMMTIAKGITNAAVPMGAVCRGSGSTTRSSTARPAGIELFHGYTYSGHPLARGRGVATLELYRTRRAVRARRVARVVLGGRGALAARLAARHRPAQHRLIGGIELEPRAGAPGARAFETFVRCFQKGVLVRPAGDILEFSPPFIVEKEQIGEIFRTVGEALNEVD